MERKWNGGRAEIVSLKCSRCNGESVVPFVMRLLILRLVISLYANVNVNLVLFVSEK